MNKIQRIIVSLKAVLLEIELELLKQYQNKSAQENRAQSDTILNNLLKYKIAVRAQILPDKSVLFLVSAYPGKILRVKLQTNKTRQEPQFILGLDGEFQMNICTDEIDIEKESDGDLEKVIKKWMREDKELFIDIWSDIQNGRIPNRLTTSLTVL